ncbi:MAG TPA: hypothetical protein PKH36_14330, partial [Flavobacteriales bacterium]|nr:hypothetical protein [Flavobacteriales bacterium]
MKTFATLPRCSSRIARALFLIALFTISTGAMVLDNSPAVLPFSQYWSNTGMITVNDDWAVVPSIIGYRGDGLTGGTGTDPQTLIADDLVLVVDVNANQTNPNTFSTGGVAEFEITDPTIALTGSGTADAPYLLLHLNTSGLVNIHVAYNVRDIESSADDAIQQVALHFRAGPTGSYTNVPAGYVADATTGGSATQVTPISAVLPGTANNQPDLRVRIMTTNAAGNDEWVGIDDISVTGDPDSDGDGLADAVDGCPFDPLDACNLIPPGFDCFTTGCGATSTDFSETPIPADFFDPGSEPFDGRVILGGGTLGGTDTRVQRLGDGHLLGPIPSTDVIPIELVQLNLVSCEPITVRYCIGDLPETWSVSVDLSPTPAPLGQMMVTKTHANGGFFTSQFFVQPRFTFTRVGDGAVRVLDTGLLGLPPFIMSSTGPAPWVHQASIPMNPAPCGANFVPGVQEANAPPTPGSSCTSTFQCVKSVGHAGPGHMHVTGHIATPCPCGACADPVDGSCDELSGADPATDCAAAGGVFKGIGTSCLDSDGDLIPDAYETNSRCVATACDSPTLIAYPTDPTRADTDGDGLNDNLDPEPVNRCMPLSAPNRPAVCDAFDQTLPGDGDADDDGNCDLCEIMNGGSLDCNSNGVPDENEIIDCEGIPGGPALPGTPCEDGDLCTTGETWSLSCVCQGGISMVCDDGDPCTTDTCDPLLGCVFTPIVCDDGDPCTTDTCDPLLGCVFTPIVCDDGNACTTDT